MNRKIFDSVAEATLKLNQIAKDEGFDPADLAKIWTYLPFEDTKNLDFRIIKDWIYQISELVDRQNGHLSQNSKIAKKYRLIATLLDTKAALILRISSGGFNPRGRLYFKNNLRKQVF